MLNYVAIWSFFDDKFFHNPNQGHFLFYYFIKSNYLIFPVIHLILFLGYIFFGKELIKFNDSTVFDQVANFTRKQSLLIYFVFSIFSDLTFFHARKSLIERTMKSYGTWHKIRSITSLYVYHTYFMATWFLFYHYQIILNRFLNKCRVQILGQIHLAPFLKQELDNRLFQSMKTLALQNKKYQKINSLFLLIMLIDFGLTLVRQLSAILIYGMYYFKFLLLELVLRTILWFGLAILNEKNLNCFDRMEKILMHKRWPIFRCARSKRRPAICHSKFNQMMTFYKPYFVLSVFQLITIDMSFLVGMIFFIIGYIVIIYQTSKK